MIRASRRAVLGGALAVPTLAGMASWRWKHGEASTLVHDPALEAGRRFAGASAGQARAVTGDRVRFAREILAGKPALIAGVTRHADLLMIADVAAEHGYIQAATLHVRSGRCTGNQCHPGWGAVARLGNVAGANWAEALADFAINSGRTLAGPSTGSWAGARDSGLVLGWVLAPRA